MDASETSKTEPCKCGQDCKCTNCTCAKDAKCCGSSSCGSSSCGKGASTCDSACKDEHKDKCCK